MVVMVAFERPSSEFFREYFPGVYKHASLIVISGSRVTWYDALLDQGFHSKSANDLALDDDNYDFVVLDTSQDEDESIIRTCDACCECRIQYTRWDQYMRNMPFWYPVDCSLFETRQMYATQSVVLILRECLSAQNPLLLAMLAINSRTISPTALKKELDDLAHTIPTSSAKRLLGIAV